MLRNRWHLPSSFGAWSALLLGLVLTIGLFVAVRGLEHDKFQLDFQQRADSRIQAVRQRLQQSVDELASINQLFVSFGSVSREQFHVFTSVVLERNPSIQAFNFHRIVSDAQRPAFEAAVRRQIPTFAITELSNGRLIPAARRAQYRVVEYMEPLRGNEAALGFDAASYALQTGAMQRAIATGKPSATGLLRLNQETGDQLGLIVLMPVYMDGAVTPDAAARRAALIGDTAAVFRIGSLVETAVAVPRLSDTAGVQLALYLMTPSGAQLAYSSQSQIVPAAGIARVAEWLFYDRPQQLARDFQIAGRSWRMVASTAPASFISIGSGSLWLLLVGLLLSGMVAGYVQLLSSRTRRVERLVRRRTAELRLANRHLRQDIVARIRAEKALQLHQRVVESSANAIVIVNAEGPDYLVEYVNPAFEHSSGFGAAEMVGQPLLSLQYDERDQQALEEIRMGLRERKECKAMLRTVRKDGTRYWIEFYVAPVLDTSSVTGDSVSHFVVAQYDITATKNYEEELEFQANHDTLTGLANRNLLRDRLSQAIVYADRYGHPVWLVHIGLDQFKFINDALGHHAGDAVLRAVAERLRNSLRNADTVARIGGDEFLLIFIDGMEHGAGVNVIQRTMQAIAEPLKVDGHELFLTCSVGIATCPNDAVDAETLTKHAGIAMYRAKDMGRGLYQFYTPEMNLQALERLQLESDMRGALERNEFVLHYQPQVELHSGQVVGMEALIRWQHPRLGLVPPARFISLAEESGMIVAIGTWVVRTACRQNKAWQENGGRPLRVWVNLSARQFYEKDLAQVIAAILEEVGLAPRYLGVELTESLVMADVEHAVEILHQLQRIGVQMSIDDFGTGYSSLAYLKRFPINVLKIDQSFVRDIALDAYDAAIVLSIISLAHNLKMNVIAEGVETAEQLEFLGCNQCDEIQGYHFSRPLPADQFCQLIRDAKCLPPLPGATGGDSSWHSVSHHS